MGQLLLTAAVRATDQHEATGATTVASQGGGVVMAYTSLIVLVMTNTHRAVAALKVTTSFLARAEPPAAVGVAQVHLTGAAR